MTFEYGNFFYFFYLFLVFAFTATTGILLRKKSDRTKKTVIFILAVLNVFQHFFKQFLYPHLWGHGFDYMNTVYNVCSFLIVATPIVFFSKSDSWKDFITYAGSSAGLITMLVPYWYVGGSPFRSEILQFYVYHGLLFATSLLPVITGLHKLSWRNFWKIGLLFYLSNILVLFNNFTVVVMEGKAENMYAILREQNPLWMFSPPDNPGFAFFSDIVKIFSPKIFYNPEAGVCVPILWSAVPLYLLLTVLSLLIGCFADSKNMDADLRRFFSRFRKKH